MQAVKRLFLLPKTQLVTRMWYHVMSFWGIVLILLVIFLKCLPLFFYVYSKFDQPNPEDIIVNPSATFSDRPVVTNHNQVERQESNPPDYSNFLPPSYEEALRRHSILKLKHSWPFMKSYHHHADFVWIHDSFILFRLYPILELLTLPKRKQQ